MTGSVSCRERSRGLADKRRRLRRKLLRTIFQTRFLRQELKNRQEPVLHPALHSLPLGPLHGTEAVREDRVVANREQVTQLRAVARDQVLRRSLRALRHGLPGGPQRDLDLAVAAGRCIDARRKKLGREVRGVGTELVAKLPLCSPFDQAVNAGDCVIESTLARAPLGIQSVVPRSGGLVPLVRLPGQPS